MSSWSDSHDPASQQQEKTIPTNSSYFSYGSSKVIWREVNENPVSNTGVHYDISESDEENKKLENVCPGKDKARKRRILKSPKIIGLRNMKEQLMTSLVETQIV